MNVQNRTLFIADNLDILRGINSDCIDLIYLDPPFNSKRNYKAPIGSLAEGAEFKDIWTDADVRMEWHGQIAEQHEELYQIIQASEVAYDKSMKIYLTAMAIRLFEMKRILKTTGSIYLHCDPTASHYLKLVMDSLFGEKNFRNEIVWKRRADTHNLSTKHMGRNHDLVFFYVKSPKSLYRLQYTEYDSEYIQSHYKHEDTKGLYRLLPCTNESGGNKPYSFRGITRAWRFSEANMNKMYDSNLLVQLRDGGPYYYKKYLSEAKGVPLQSIWNDIPPVRGAKEKTGYPTQKPLALLDRIIKASSNKGDIVLDPFCGCATACVAAEKLGRQWIGIDISPSAETITKLRLDEASEQGALFSPIQMSDVIVRSDAPVRTDNTEEIATQIKLPHYTTHKPALFGKQQGHCNGCRNAYLYKDLDVDHIIARKRGGGDNIENLQLLCGHCNSTKGDGTQADLVKRLQAQKEKRLSKQNVA